MVHLPKKEKFNHLVELLNTRCQTLSQKNLFTFLEDGDAQESKITYGQLEQQAKRIAADLQKRQLVGERVVLIYIPGLDYIASFFACLYAGVVAVPAYPPDPSRLERTLPRLQAIVQDCQAKAILTSSNILAMAEYIGTQAPQLAAMDWIASDQVAPGLEEKWEYPDLNENSLAFLQYTSGSTGDPKGVMLSHGNLLSNLETIFYGFGMISSDKGCSWLPPYHDMGLIGPIIESIYASVESILMSPLHFLQKPMRWLKAISRYQATISGGPNFAYELCARKAKPEEIAELDLSSWKVAFSGAEPIMPETVKLFSETFAPCGFRPEALYPCYGLAEATLMVSGARQLRGFRSMTIPQKQFRRDQILSKPADDEKMLTLIGAGESFPGQKIVIAKPDTMTECQEAEVGEIWVKGATVALGYWQKPEATQAAFAAYLQDSQEGPFLRTGDLGFLKDGELYVTGRLKDLIIIRGENHYPQDIERSAEKSHPALRVGCSAAFSIKVGYEEKLALAIEIDCKKLDEEKPDYDKVYADIREAIALEHELEVHTIILLDKGAIPKTSSGKIRRSTTYQEWQEGKLEIIDFDQHQHVKQDKGAEASQQSSSQNSTQKDLRTWLAQTLAEHLGIEIKEIDSSKNLASYGLDSKDAVNLSGELEDYLGRTLSPTLLWKYPTIDSLADYLLEEGV